MNSISIRQLTFGYRKSEPILDRLSFEVPQGSIFGFLGANGAGKTTTLKNILGLLRPNSGEIEVFGQPLQNHRKAAFSRIGSLIEAPVLYRRLTAREQLELVALYHPGSRSRIKTVLDQVGLSYQSTKRSGQYSMGMKQRLGLAMALLHDPELLILDEPTNGLDPTGIAEIRQLLFDLRGAGKTILLSSHLLSEIEKTVTHIGIIKDGKMAFTGQTSELTSDLESTYLSLTQSTLIS